MIASRVHSHNGRAPQLAFEAYLRKTFYKTASLIANSCRSAAMLGGHSDGIVEASYLYGKVRGQRRWMLSRADAHGDAAHRVGVPACG
jgi:hypothetical protein